MAPARHHLRQLLQVPLFVAPVLVLLRHLVAPQPFDPAFHRAGLGVLFLGVLIDVVLSGDGRGNWFKKFSCWPCAR